MAASFRKTCLFFALAAAFLAPTAMAERPEVPDDLLDDEHFREEIGINDLTTPSIRKIFDRLADLGPIPYEAVQVKVSKPTAEDRVGISLHLGFLIADGFLAVQCERFGEMEALGKGVLDHAELLSIGRHLRPHSKALLEHASLRQTDRLKEELVRTQRDIEREMADLRDVDIAHLVSLGGWIRAFQVGCATVAGDFKEENARRIARTDIVEYYQAQLANLHPNLQKREDITALRAQLAGLADLLDVPTGVAVTEKDVARWREKAEALLTLTRREEK